MSEPVRGADDHDLLADPHRVGVTEPRHPHGRRHALELIDSNARVQAQLIEELLDVSRIISGKLRLDVQAMDLCSVVEGVIESMRPAADSKEIRLQKMLDPSAGPVMGDANRIQQVVWNLLSNAIKFTPKGGHVQVLLQRVNSSVEATPVATSTRPRSAGLASSARSSSSSRPRA